MTAEGSLQGQSILVTGGLGMLAADILPALFREKVNVIATDIIDGERHGLSMIPLDIGKLQNVRDVVGEIKPSWIVNCAAYTAVDAAETNREAAFAVNAFGPANLARAAKENGARLLHLSTDYVFGGNGEKRTTPYREEDSVAPCGVYGQSKRAGDEHVTTLLPEASLVVRTSWLHGVYGPNFIATILKLAQGKNQTEIRVVNDQVGSPTYSGWLAPVLVKLMKRNARGVFHATSRGNISWYDFAKEIVQQTGLTVQVVPQSTAELGRPAPRPFFSTLDVSKLEGTLGAACIDWREGLTAHLRALGIAK